MNEKVVKLFEPWILEYFSGAVSLERYSMGFKGYKEQQTHDMYWAFLNGWRVNNSVKDNT